MVYVVTILLYHETIISVGFLIFGLFCFAGVRNLFSFIYFFAFSPFNLLSSFISNSSFDLAC